MTENLKKWIEDNKLIVSEQKLEGLDTIKIDSVGTFLFVSPGDDGKIIDDDFSFILTDEEYEVLDEKKVDYILFEFGGKFYYSGIKADKNRYNEPIYKPEFNDFKYLGKCSEDYILDFTHLGVHDEYEMLSGSGSCELWCKKAKFLGHTAIGVCDKNSLASSLSFQTYAEKFGLKAIIGETITVARNYDASQEIQETFELKLYVMNPTGWHNLLLISKSLSVDYDGFIPDKVLYKYGKGLCCVVPNNSEFNYLVRRGDKKAALSLIETYKKVFRRVYYQIDTVEYTSKQLFREHLKDIDDYIRFFRNKIKPIVINDSYYLDEEEKDLKGMLHKISGLAAPEANNQFFKSVGDTFAAYSDWLDDVEPLFEVISTGIQNTALLTSAIDFRISNTERKIPKFEVEDPEGMFFKELQKGIEKKLVGKVENLDEYMKRIEVECNLIVPNDLCSYFLILWDILNWCKKEDISVGPGRGSVCGSLVAYCLDITQVDPLKYQLYFERFLNSSRVSAHHAYYLTLEDGREVVFRDGDKIPLVGGKSIEASHEVDFNKLDIDIEKI